MFKFFRKPETSNDKKVNSAADDIHEGMGTKEPLTTICGAIDAKKFADFAHVKLIKRTGPKQGAAAKWIFGF